jgi:hypothetical protein
MLKTGSLFFFLVAVSSICIFPGIAYSQSISTPLEAKNFVKPTSYDELSTYVNQLDESSALLNAEIIGSSVQGRNLYALLFSGTTFGLDASKLKVLIFAQQHGNEQSGKEGALLLAKELLQAHNRYLFKKLDIAIVPQVNPDGSEVNKRRNANDMDLNRNHVILTEPETQALHRLFDRYLFEVTMDVHEYSPYGEDWEAYGYRKNAEITIGVTTNPNVSGEIRKYSNDEYVPYILKYLNDNSFSSFIYCPGGPPGVDYIRHSTFDVNDGRQSLGIQNSLSFIQEGMNGQDDYSDNLRLRTQSQMTGMRGLIEFSYNHKDQIREMIHKERMDLLTGKSNSSVSIQSIHVNDGRKLSLPLVSYKGMRDTVVIVDDYRPIVKSILNIEKPVGYLIPMQSKELHDWADRQDVGCKIYSPNPGDKLEQYYIISIDSIDFEGDITINPGVEVHQISPSSLDGHYCFVSTSQLKGNMLVLAVEPKSMLSLATYSKYAHLVRKNEFYPIIRVLNK